MCWVSMCLSVSKREKKEPELIIEMFPHHTLQSGDYFRNSGLCLAPPGDRNKIKHSQQMISYMFGDRQTLLRFLCIDTLSFG